MHRILLAEDNPIITKGLCYTLAAEQFDVDCAETFECAQEKILSQIYDLAIVDIALPDGNGVELCRLLKEAAPVETPVIFLTAKNTENDVVTGFDAGADDYIAKPFRNRELVSRIKNILRRYRKDETELVCGNLRLDLEANRVWLDGQEVVLTALEYRILVLLMRSKGQTVPREKILSVIWDYAGNVVNDNTLTVYIKRIRNKIGEERIRTVVGIGYRMEDDPAGTDKKTAGERT